jgi:hypothetical protein
MASWNGSDCTTLVEGGSCSFWFGLKPASLGVKHVNVVLTFQGGRLPEGVTLDSTAVLESMRLDKKSVGGRLRFVGAPWMRGVSAPMRPARTASCNRSSGNQVFGSSALVCVRS